MRRCFVTLAVLLAFGSLAGPVRGQEPPDAEQGETPKAPERRERRPSDTLRVQLVIARFQGEKKVASLPYSLNVTADGSKARLRMGVETPVPVTQYMATTSEGSSKPSTSFQYKNVGTNIDCSARDIGEGHYALTLGIENSSVLAGPGSAIAKPASPTLEGLPLFRSFSVSIHPVLRDGQSTQTVASTDPVTGEVVKIDVTLNVVR